MLKINLALGRARRRRAPTARRLLLLLVAGGLPLSGCRKICDNEDAPVYTLTQGQRAWGNGLVKNEVWRFRNARGYERTYRVKQSEYISQGGGGGKSSFCSTYFTEYKFAALERTDSAAHPLETFFNYSISPSIPAQNKPFTATIQLGGGVFRLPIDEVEDGRLALRPATFGGRTYPAVLESTSYSPLPKPRPTETARIFVTKELGVVRFEEFGGTVWDRQ